MVIPKAIFSKVTEPEEPVSKIESPESEQTGEVVDKKPDYVEVEDASAEEQDKDMPGFGLILVISGL
ncbi:hypothetical protein HNV12_18980 [Methanococcoides sp. SA1]|nr:hypothetical protein [Methanococcoides sp. SA1]